MRFMVFWERWGAWARARRIALVLCGCVPLAVAVPISLTATTAWLEMNPGAALLYATAPLTIWAWGLLIAAAWFAPQTGAFSRWRESGWRCWAAMLTGAFLCLYMLMPAAILVVVLQR